MKPVRMAVIGAGIMGANHARVVKQLQTATLTAVVDQDLERANLVVGPEGRGVVDLAEVIDEIDAAVVAVPTKFHHDITLQLLRAGKHVLVEKPIAATEVEAKAMVEAAEELGVVFTVGHIERFNPAVVELSKWIENPVHIRIERINPYSERILDGVVMDLMIHDLDIVLSLADGVEVVDVEGIGHHVRSDSEDLAVVTLRFANGLTASLTTSRLGQQKIRQIESLTEKLTENSQGKIESRKGGLFRRQPAGTCPDQPLNPPTGQSSGYGLPSWCEGVGGFQKSVLLCPLLIAHNY